MRQLRILVAVCAFLGTVAAFAHGDEKILDSDIIKMETFNIGGSSRVVIMVTERGDALGKPYYIDARPLCRASDTEWQQSEVQKSTPACEVLTETLRYDSKTGEVSVDARMPDMEAYHREMLNNPDADISCQKEIYKVRFTIKGMCGSK